MSTLQYETLQHSTCNLEHAAPHPLPWPDGSAFVRQGGKRARTRAPIFRILFKIHRVVQFPGLCLLLLYPAHGSLGRTSSGIVALVMVVAALVGGACGAHGSCGACDECRAGNRTTSVD